MIARRTSKGAWSPNSNKLEFDPSGVPHVRIVYCVPCGFLPKAVQLATDLLKRYGTKYLKNFSVTLDTGDGGVFDVYVDERLVFSRKAEGGKFPTVNDIAKYLE